MRLVVFCLVTVLFLVCGCANESVVITPQYISNADWNRKAESLDGNRIKIARLKLKQDSVLDPFAAPGQDQLLNRLEVDSAFYWAANVKIKGDESYEGKKIYFNRDNGFYWWDRNRVNKTAVIGDLKKNSWYEFTELNPGHIIVYIDSANKVHRFTINQANY
jgi:hypothetical protein